MNILKKSINTYVKNGQTIKDKDTLQRIKKLSIPPNWKSVKISDSNINYLQVVGKDIKGKTQYIYHPIWNELTKIHKYSRLKLFSDKLPILLKRVDSILSRKIDFSNKEYLTCLILKILSLTYARIGNETYAENNKTYGLTTLLKKHLKINKDVVELKFIGKKYVPQHLIFKDARIANILSNLIKLPGDKIFKTSNDEPITSLDVNNYMKDLLGSNFTCKDFRTYASNLLLITHLCKIKTLPKTQTETKLALNGVIEKVAEYLGHTKMISKKSYIMPIIIEKFTEDPKFFIGGKSPQKIFKYFLNN